MSRLFRLMIAVGLMTGCDEDSPLEPLRDFTFTYATNSCGPTDAPIVAIFLATQSFELPQPVAPYIQVHLPKSFTELTSGEVFPVGEPFTIANAWFHGSGVEPSAASRGTVGVTALSADLLSGYIDLEFDNGPRFRGSFVATWQSRTLLCG